MEGGKESLYCIAKNQVAIDNYYFTYIKNILRMYGFTENGMYTLKYCILFKLFHTLQLEFWKFLAGIVLLH